MFGSVLYYDRSMKWLRRYYHYLFGAQHIGTRIHALHVFNRLKGISFQNLLDVGCGLGIFSLSIAKSRREVSILGVDVDKDSVEYANQLAGRMQLENAQFKVSDMNNGEHLGAFDIILMVEVLEHIDDDMGMLKNLYRLLKAGGRVIIHVPHIERNHIFPGMKDCRIGEAGEGFMGHARDGYALDGLTEKLTKTGFEIIEASYTRGFWGTLAWELEELGPRNKVLKAFYFPFLLLLIQGERWSSLNKGDGILVQAKKG
jgi:SAM-dependent methyltransferase